MRSFIRPNFRSNRIIPAFLTTLLIGLAAGNAIGDTTATGVQVPPQYDAYQPPTVGGSYVDPDFGSTIKRITNALITPNVDAGGNLTWIETEYSGASAFSSDNSKFILVHQSYFGLYAGDGTFVRNLPMEISSSSEPRWSRKDNATLYYHVGNMLKSYNTSTGAITVVHTFSEYSSISGNGEMDISLDGDHFVLQGDNRYIFVYQISTGRKFRPLDTAGTPFDSLYITPKNNVIVSWYPAGTVRYTGQELFDTNMNFLRQVGHADGHKHVTVDTNGDEVLVWTNSADPQPIANCQNGIVKIRLADATQTCLVQLDWSLAVHITAPDGNGTAFFETYAPADPMPGTSGWVAYTNELVQVKLDGSGVVGRIAHHLSQPRDSYVYMPKLTVSRDGTRILYGSNFDLQAVDSYPAEYADAYMIVLGNTSQPAATTTPAPAPAPTPAPAPSTTTTTTTSRYEQNSPSVQYAGTWFPNGGGFNSGGSAVMATDANSSATFTFTGTGVNWIGFSDPWSGTAHVYLDGTLVATVDTYSAVQKSQAVEYSVSSLANTSHTLAIVATGNHDASSAGSWVWVDAFDVTTTSAAAPQVITAPALTGLIQQDNAAVQYSGSWYPNANSADSGGSAVLAMDAGSQAQFSFTGTAIQWIGLSDPYSGIAQVYVDGALVGTVDCYAAAEKAATVEYTVSNLTRGTHTLTITVTGTRNASSAGSWVWLDALNVTN